MHPEHWSGLPKLVSRAMVKAGEKTTEINIGKAQQVIEGCWGDDPGDIDYVDFVNKIDFHQYVVPAASAAGLAVNPFKWENAIRPALLAVNANTLVCKSCGELGLQRIGNAWESIAHGQCPLCTNGVMVAVTAEERPINWINGQTLEAGRTNVNENGVLIPLTRDGVLAYVRDQLHGSINAMFADVNPLQALNWLLNSGKLTKIQTAQDALQALAYPFPSGVLPTHAALMKDSINRNEIQTRRSLPIEPAPTLTRREARTAIDQAPLAWTDGRVQRLLEALLVGYSPSEAAHLGERVGIKKYHWDSSGAPKFVIRNLMEAACNSSKLRALVEEARRDRNVASIHRELDQILA